MLDIAVGVFLALAATKLFEHGLVMLRDYRRVQMLKGELVGAADNFIDKMHAEMEAEKAAEAAKKARRRKPATQGKGKIKGAATTKPVAKKGATNVKAKARR